MSKVNAEIVFQNDFNGQLRNKNGDVVIGEKGLAPYDMLQGALAACLHATFLSILDKKHLTIKQAHYQIDGTKRETSPTTLSEVHLTVRIKTEDNIEQLKHSFDLATKYCSVFNTISQVAVMTYQLSFED
ncbi:MAG: OsmC family protein [Erysipelotrichaceae bacterium]|nr:OsmC family protein [Erysipelotrichaceae bacterium]